MGLRDLFRKYRKRHNTSHDPSPIGNTEIAQPSLPPPSSLALPLPLPQQQQQQQKQDKTGLASIDINTKV